MVRQGTEQRRDNNAPTKKQSAIKKAPKRKRMQRGYRRVDLVTRINIIYDSQLHNMCINDLIVKYDINYNTARHIIV